ncbi:salicylate hydroxylase [Talaromyces proteolyticus]|uniref:Salicylate hydroxylase n=1 Tax=Talaromyces proteolyticus TaxID=1131652 RepID=A0AAD4KGW9_9EURO|nr:salicylate hydroxylase [Talaromyces proteolyticus]KAH8690112.1 salicylate hydroxylase [Talaromyces proteolyticus]
MLRDIIIIGSGITGLSTALSLSHHLSSAVPDLRITIFERHFIPSTSGGAIGLSPVALRYLDHLGVMDELAHLGPEAGADVDGIEVFSARTGKSLGQVDFAGKNGVGIHSDKGPLECQKTYKGARLPRINLTLAMISAVEKRPNIKIVYGKKLSHVSSLDDEDKVEIHFDDGSRATGDLLLGCDGVHSATRRNFIDPGHEAEYSGFTLVQSTIPTASLQTSPHFRATSLNFSKSGTMLMTFCDKFHQEMFVSVMLECREDAVGDYVVVSNEERKRIIRESLAREVRMRYGDSAIPCIRETVSRPDIDWMMYPIFQVPLGGRWYTDKAILLGDAAHAMLPRDESAAYAIDDAIVLSRVLAEYIAYPLTKAFEVYESMRRDEVTHAFKESRKLWKRRNKDAGAFESWVRERLVPLQLRQTEASRQAAFKADASRIEIPSPITRLGTGMGSGQSSGRSSPASLRPFSKAGSSASSGSEMMPIGLMDMSGLAMR